MLRPFALFSRDVCGHGAYGFGHIGRVYAELAYEILLEALALGYTEGVAEGFAIDGLEGWCEGGCGLCLAG